MKSSDKTKNTARAILTGDIFQDGYMGDDRRQLNEIIRSDEETVKSLNLTHKKIAERMMEFREKGQKGLGDYVKVAPHFEVRCDVERGKLPCPFGEPGMHRKTNTGVRSLGTGKEISFSDLNIHMIAAHGFYEGKGSPFRLEPADLAEILEIREE